MLTRARAARRSTGWLTWWGQSIANSSVWDFLDTFDQILRYNNNMGSVTLYMAAGGTNFAYTAGAALPAHQRCCQKRWNPPWSIASAVSRTLHPRQPVCFRAAARGKGAAKAPGLA
jgi:hypothetical protein